MKKSNKLFFLCALCFGTIVGTLYHNQDKPDVVYADNPTPLTDTQLHSLTKASYFRNETPAITIFMHGLGCEAYAEHVVNRNGGGASLVKPITEPLNMYN